MSDAGEVTVPAPDSEAENGRKHRLTAERQSEPQVNKIRAAHQPNAGGALSTYVGPQERGGPHWTQRVSG